MKKTQTTLLISGSLAYDEIMNFPGGFADHFHAEKLHQINVSFAVDRLTRQLGGVATNIAYSAAHALRFLEASNMRVEVVGSVGRDGKELISFLKRNKVKTGNISIDNTVYTATGKVITDRQDNQIWGYYYGASANKLTLSPSLFEGRPFAVLSATHKAPFLQIQKKCIDEHVPYLYDPGMTLTWIADADLRRGVLHAQLVIGNDYEIAAILKRLGTSIEALTKRTIQVIVTKGSQGADLYTSSGTYTVGVVPGLSVVDPTGAGDAFRGGFIAGYLIGRSPIECLRLGTGMASFAVEQYGTVTYVPRSVEIRRRLNKV